eukprot:TRINITY_DN4981_c0_g3_i1.p1 TRINITY_DN4981_c0_g3~~TRINITY_DN4981_c0_g3_i1.p1  ORF type:complete len:725 (-),score=97.01 TRINITY_DN4981_c0_g3_i1:346-2493(-)
MADSMRPAFDPDVLRPLIKAAPTHRILQLSIHDVSQVKCVLGDMHSGLDECCPPGLLVVNSSESSRLKALTEQVESLQRSPLLLTCCAPQKFPALFTASEKGSHLIPWTPATQREPTGQFRFKFDRVFCDVPCSEDVSAEGCRTPCSMHNMQVKILQRGLQCLAPGGRLVYVSRSFSPVECEAVVATALLTVGRGQGVELVSDFTSLSHLPQSEGFETWHVPHPDSSDDTCEYFESLDKVPPKLRGGRVRATMFPPGGNESSTCDARHQLKKCIRILPDFVGYGCFAAVFHKRETLITHKISSALTLNVGLRRPEQITSSCDIDDDDDLQEVHAGSKVTVRASGAPAVVIGPGSKAYEGLVKIRYPDRSTYHLPIEDLQVAETKQVSTQSLVKQKCTSLRPRVAILTGGVALIGLLLYRLRLRRKRAALVTILTAALFVLKRWQRSAALQRDRPVPMRGCGAKLVRGFVATPATVKDFMDLFGLLADESPAACAGVAVFPCTALHYRTTTTDKLTLHLASKSLAELRVPPDFREFECGMPVLTRCVSAEDKRRWGNASLRPLSCAAPLLARCATRRRLHVNGPLFAALLQAGNAGLPLSALGESKFRLAAAGAQSSLEDVWRRLGAVILVLQHCGWSDSPSPDASSSTPATATRAGEAPTSVAVAAIGVVIAEHSGRGRGGSQERRLALEAPSSKAMVAELEKAIANACGEEVQT